MQGEARGTFEVTLLPIGGNDGPIGVLSIDKIFHGDLQGSSVGQMLAFRTPVEGSAGYVPELSVVVVPDSGSDGLQGLAGTLEISITQGRHDYRLLYSLPDAG